MPLRALAICRRKEMMSGRFCSATAMASPNDSGGRRLGDVQAARNLELRHLPGPADRSPQLGLARRQRRRAGANLALGIEHGKPDSLGLDRPRAAELDAGLGDALDALQARQVFLGEFQHRPGFEHVVERAGRVRQPLPHLVAVVGVGHRHADLGIGHRRRTLAEQIPVDRDTWR